MAAGSIPLHGAIVVNTDLGVIDNLIAPVTGSVAAAAEDGSGNNVQIYPDLASGTYNGPEQVFQFEVSTSQTVTLTRNSVSGDPDSFFLNSLETGAVEDGADLTAQGPVLAAFLDDGDGTSVVTSLDPGTYYLSVEGFNGAAADFDFSLSAVDFVEPEPVVGDTPENAASWGSVGVVGDLIDINTFGSLGDTELGLFDSLGGLISINDDAQGLLSQIIFEPTSEGTYYIATGNYNSVFSLGFGATGPVGAAVTLTVNGADVDFLVEGTGAFWTSFNIVPEPSSLSLVAFAGLALLRRRRS